MLKRMRRRFVCAAMAAIFAVMTMLLLAINLLNYTINTSRQDETLAMLAEFQGLERPGERPDHRQDDRDGPFPRAPFVPMFFSVLFRQDGSTEIVNEMSDSLAEEDAEQYARAVLERGGSSGYYGEYRYLAAQEEEGTRLYFLNSSPELQVMQTLFSVSCGVEAVSLLTVFVLVVAFSKWAIDPYIRNMERQKQFITDAGHELKTPITSIATSADVLAMEQENNEWVQNIQKQALRLTKLVSNLITLSRLDEASPFPEKTVFSLSEAAWEASEPFAALAGAKGKRFSQRIEEGLSLSGDKASIQQMLSILLDNAVRYSLPGGSIRLEVYRRRRSCVIQVSNTCDMDAIPDLNRLFDRFYRPDKSRSTHTGGTGIGLSIARATAEAHGGSISAERREGNVLLIRAVL